MSHRFKQATHVKPSDEIAEKTIRRFAASLRDQQDLERLLDGADDFMREAMIERLMPYLTFPVFNVDPTPDCHCGFKRGSLIPHACTN